MKDLQKIGGVASLLMAASFGGAFVLVGTVLLPAGYSDSAVDAAGKVAIVIDNQASLTLTYLAAYMIFGALLVALSLALYHRLKAMAIALAQLATAFGLIWAGLVIASGMVTVVGIDRIVELASTNLAQAAAAWVALDIVASGLGGEMEFVGGLWVLLASAAALKARELPKLLNYLGVVIGIAGLLTVIPALTLLAAVFGLGLIVWFVWLGLILLRTNLRTT